MCSFCFRQGAGRGSLSRGDLFAQIGQAVQCLGEGVVLLGKVQADQVVDRLAEEAGAGHRAHANVARQHLAELQVGIKAEFRNVEHDIIRALRLGVGDFEVAQTLQEQIALAGVFVLKPFVILRAEAQAGDGGFLQRRSRAHGQKIVHLLGHVDDFRRGDDVAQTPAGDGIGLGKRAARDGALPHAGQRGKIGVHVGRVDDVFVNFVRDDIGIVFDGQLRDGFQLLTGKDLATGVGRVAQDQRLGVLAEGVLQFVGIEAEFRRVQRDVDRLRAGEDGVRTVVFIEGREHDHLVAGVGHRHHRGHHRLGAAAGDDDFSVGVDGAAHQAALLFGQRLAEVLRAPGDGVLVEILVRHLGQAVEDLLGRLEIREALGEVHCAVLQRNARHAADDGIGKALGAIRKFLHVLLPIDKTFCR